MNAMKLFSLLALAGILRSVSAFGGDSGGPLTAFAYQGHLTDNGIPANGIYDLSFRLLGEDYEVIAGGGPRWSDTELMRPASSATIEDVRVSTGQFQVLIDFGPQVVFDGSARFLEVAVRPGASTGDFRILGPPQAIHRVPEAVHADVASILIGLLPPDKLPPVAARLDQPQTFKAAPLFSPPSGPPFHVGMTDTVQHLSADLLDGFDSKDFVRFQDVSGVRAIVEPEDRPLEIHLKNGAALRLQSGPIHPSVILGSGRNRIAPAVSGGTIGGGSDSTVEADHATVAGGRFNSIKAGSVDAVLGGGSYSSIDVNSRNAFIGGGGSHVVGSNSMYAVVVGGHGNRVRADAPYAAIGGGWANEIASESRFSVIGGGERGKVRENSPHSTISGGAGNIVHSNAPVATISGGMANQVFDNAGAAVIAGGDHNSIERGARWSSLLGGYQNTVRANATHAIVLGGESSVAGADHSLAAGYYARADHSGSFVWSDFSFGPFASSNKNEFAVRATGGTRFVSGERSDRTPVGVHLPAGAGAWSTLSDRRVKEELQPIDTRAVLERLSSVPISSWRYATQDPHIRHLGPTAQDFKAAFDLGESDTHISTVDADGVALAAIQGLHALVKEKDAEIQALKARMLELETRLDQRR